MGRPSEQGSIIFTTRMTGCRINLCSIFRKDWMESRKYSSTLINYPRTAQLGSALQVFQRTIVMWPFPAPRQARIGGSLELWKLNPKRNYLTASNGWSFPVPPGMGTDFTTAVTTGRKKVRNWLPPINFKKYSSTNWAILRRKMSSSMRINSIRFGINGQKQQKAKNTCFYLYPKEPMAMSFTIKIFQ